MQVLSFITSKGVRVDMPREMLKIWTEAAWQASVEARRKQHEEAKAKLTPDRYEDYVQHLHAGTPHEFAMALAERRR
ncbi:MAG: hypothetical protein WC208_08270 [Gallionella sp.]|jgi:hypothetical protein